MATNLEVLKEITVELELMECKDVVELESKAVEMQERYNLSDDEISYLVDNVLNGQSSAKM